MESYSVYMHTNKINNKKYIGLTRLEPECRWNNGYGYTKQIFGRAIRKYGWDSFEHEILYENLIKSEAENFEIKLIEKYKSNKGKYGYNIENGGNARGKISEETKIKISEANKGNKCFWYGKCHSGETKIKMSKANKSKGETHYMYGKHLSEETKRKLSELNKGKVGYWKGKCRSEETRIKMRESKKDAYMYNGKKIICVNTKEIFKTITECANAYNIKRSTLSSWLTRKSIYNYKYTFMYYDDYRNQYGENISEEITKNIDEARKNRKKNSTKRGKKVICIDKNEIFDSLKDCANIYGINLSTLNQWLTGRKRCTHKYTFMYYEDYLKQEKENKVAN